MPEYAKDIQPGFMVLQGNRLEDLRDLTISWLQRAPLAPLESETIVVQSNGMAQWLRAAMAQSPKANPPGLGIAAGLEMIFPARLGWQCYRAVLGSELVSAETSLDKPVLVWRLMRILPNLPDDPLFTGLMAYQLDDPLRCYQLAVKLADQFDQYQVYRPDWLAKWAEGADDIGTQNALEQRWQPALWRLILDDFNTEQQTQADLAGRAEIHQAFLQQARRLTTRPAALPRRVVVFGISSLAPQLLEVLGEIARFSQVVFCLQNPCAHYWGDIVEDRHLFTQQYQRIQARKIDASLPEEALHQHAHPLLAAWGKQGRDLLRLVDQFDQTQQSQQQPLTEVDVFTEANDDCILGQIQNDILALRPVTEIQQAQRYWEHQDQSLRFYRAHSPLREVEILHDQLLDAFDYNPDLQPRDVIVMVPDMTDYAPAINAVFGQIERDDPRYLPYAISDRSEDGSHPLYQTLMQLLDLPESRLGMSELFDLLDNAALRARFDINSDDLPLWRDWLNQAGARWGLNSDHRVDLGFTSSNQNSWTFALQRLLMGYLGQESRFETDSWITPVAGLDDNARPVLGSLFDLLQTLDHYRRELAKRHSPRAWQSLFTELLDDCFAVDAISAQTLSADEDVFKERDQAAEMLQRLQDGLQLWQQQMQQGAFDQPINREIAADAWLSQVGQHRLQQRFLVGSINFATLMPMRSIPFRHVWLLGLDDQSYPRRTPASDFDLMQHDYRPGDRSRREDDRYLFLEALLSAREVLSISWVGRDIKDNHERPASILVRQLIEHIDQCWLPIDIDKPPASQRVIDHPLQPFSNDYYHPANTGLFTYNPDWAIHRQTNQTTAQTGIPKAELPTTSTLTDLRRFFQQPGSRFYNQRLLIPKQLNDALFIDDEPFMPEYGIEGHSINQALIGSYQELTGPAPSPAQAQAIQPEAITDCLERQWQQLGGAGFLPLPPFNAALQAKLLPHVYTLLTAWYAFLAEFEQHEHLPLPACSLIFNGQQLEVPASHEYHYQKSDERARIVLIGSKLHAGRGKKRWDKLAGLWLDHLIATIRTNQAVTTYLISPTSIPKKPTTGDGAIRFAALSPDNAVLLLEDIIRLSMDAYQNPLPAHPELAAQIFVAKPKALESKAARAIHELITKEQRYGGEQIMTRLWGEPQRLLDQPDWQDINQRLYDPMLANTH